MNPDVIALMNVAVALVLAIITAIYARSTAQMLSEMRRQSRLLAISVAAGVEAGIMQMPPPDEYSQSHKDTVERLRWIREKMHPLLVDTIKELSPLKPSKER